MTTAEWQNVGPELFTAAKEGDDERVAEILAERPELIDQVDFDRMTALHFAASGGHEKVVARLLAARPTLAEAKTCGNWSALSCAVAKGHDKVVEQILAAAPHLIHAPDQYPLHRAAMFGQEKIVAMLLAASPDLLHAVCGGDWLSLHCECTASFVAKLWRMNPRALHALGKDARTPFHIAVKMNKTELIDMFQWSLSFDEIVSAFTKEQVDFEDRYRPIMEQQCESLVEYLNQDVTSVVFEFLGFDPVKKRPCKRANTNDDDIVNTTNNSTCTPSKKKACCC